MYMCYCMMIHVHVLFVVFCVEENEKLKAQVVDSETCIATLTEEKTSTNSKTTLYHSITV